MLQQTEFLFVAIEIAHQNDVVFPAPVGPDRPINLRQGVDLRFCFGGLGVDINQGEGKRLIGRWAADAERSDHRRTLKQIVRIVDGVDRGGIDFDGLGVVDESVLFFAIGAPRCGPILKS